MRRQLTLFVPPPRAEPIETVWRLVDPVQHRLIAAHVTLARGDGPGGFVLALPTSGCRRRAAR
ncbi:MAG: hypothetical protein IAE99_06720 [Rhodothermales bacterium]|nr:hypothetical protein [Rhodothermales bacterium]